MSVIEGPYLNDILNQPEAVRNTIRALRESDPGTVRELIARSGAGPILLTGMGSSCHALHPLALRLIARGHTPLMVETGELIHARRGLIRPGGLIVAVSQSGRSVEIVHLLRLAKGRANLIGVTNTPGSPLARQAEAVVMMAAGEESTVSCKTYLATLVALEWLGDVMLNGNGRRISRMAPAATAAETYLKAWRRHVAALTRQLDGIDSLFLLGRGASLAAAGTGGLIVKESAHFHSEGMSTAAFRHGPFEMTSPRVAVLLFDSDARFAELTARLAADIRRAGGRVFLAGHSGRGPFRLPPVTRAALPLIELLPVEIITLALAARAGREAGRFDLASKITISE